MRNHAVRRTDPVCVWLLAALLAMAALGPAAAAETLVLGGVEYEHRWSRNGQHEYTPAGQEDLERWRDMLSLVVRSDVADGEGLAAVANGLLEDYRKSGAIVRTDSRPATPGQPAEHLIVALLGGGPLVEAAFARLLLHDGTGVIVVRPAPRLRRGGGHRSGRLAARARHGQRTRPVGLGSAAADRAIAGAAAARHALTRMARETTCC